MLTEQEAKEKWCPQVRRSSVLAETHMGAPTVATAVNVGTVKKNRCIASECMMWRWSAKSRCTNEKDLSYCCVAVYEDLPREQWTGYCGLAGKP